MKYVSVEPDRKFRGPVHWGHQIHLYVKWSRYDELHVFLNQVVGCGNWRMKKPGKQTWDVTPITRVKFLKKDHAVRMKLMWDACDEPKNIFFPTMPPAANLHSYQLAVLKKMAQTHKPIWVSRQSIGRTLRAPDPITLPGGSAIEYPTRKIHTLKCRTEGDPNTKTLVMSDKMMTKITEMMSK